MITVNRSGPYPIARCTTDKDRQCIIGIGDIHVGAATFNENEPLRRDLNPVVGQSAPSGWLPQGRDLALESALLGRLQQVYSSR